MMDFSNALSRIKAGEKMTRVGWNGKGMYVFMLDKHALPDAHKNKNVVDFTKYKTQPFLVLKTAQETLVPWLVSQADLFAEDWIVIR